MAAIQLLATRTSTRAHAARSGATSEAASATSVKTAATMPRTPSAPGPACAMAVPFREPCRSPSSAARAVTAPRGSGASPATRPPSSTKETERPPEQPRGRQHEEHAPPVGGSAQPGQQGQPEDGDQVLGRQDEVHQAIIEGAEAGSHEMGFGGRRPCRHLLGHDLGRLRGQGQPLVLANLETEQDRFPDDAR